MHNLYLVSLLVLINIYQNRVQQKSTHTKILGGNLKWVNTIWYRRGKGELIECLAWVFNYTMMKLCLFFTHLRILGNVFRGFSPSLNFIAVSERVSRDCSYPSSVATHILWYMAVQPIIISLQY